MQGFLIDLSFLDSILFLFFSFFQCPLPSKPFQFQVWSSFINQPDRVEAVFGAFADGSASVLDYPIQISDYDQGRFFLTLLNGIFHSVIVLVHD